MRDLLGVIIPGGKSRARSRRLWLPIRKERIEMYGDSSG